MTNKKIYENGEKAAKRLADKVVGRTVSALFQENSEYLYIDISDPMGLIPAAHALEYQYEKGHKPRYVRIQKIFGSPDEEIDLTFYSPKWKVVSVVYPRNGTDASQYLNSYLKFLDESFLEFPSNLLIKKANRKQMEKLSENADYAEDNLLFFSNPEESSMELISRLNNYPIQYKMKINQV